MRGLIALQLDLTAHRIAGRREAAVAAGERNRAGVTGAASSTLDVMAHEGQHRIGFDDERGRRVSAAAGGIDVEGQHLSQ